MGMRVGMGMGVRMIVLKTDVRDDFDPALLDPAHRQNLLRERLQFVRSPADDDDLQAVVVAQVDVHRRPDAVSQLVLHLGQFFGQVADVVVIDDGQGGDGIDTRANLGAHHFGAGQIAKQFGPGTAAVGHQFVQLGQQRGVDRDAETNQGNAHGQKIRHPLPVGIGRA